MAVTSSQEGDTFKIASATPRGDKFELTLRRIKSERGEPERTALRIKWAKEADESFWGSLMAALQPPGIGGTSPTMGTMPPGMGQMGQMQGMGQPGMMMGQQPGVMPMQQGFPGQFGSPQAGMPGQFNAPPNAFSGPGNGQ
jgi:hypothetical protein